MGIARIAGAIRRPARASGMLGPEGSTGAFSPFGLDFHHLFILKKLLLLQQLSLFGEGDGNRTHVRKHLHGSVSERSL